MLYLELDRTQERSYSKQIYAQIREEILSGELRAKDMLPSTRDLSKDLCVARNTVLTAYDILVSEGFLFSLPGSGFFVSSEITCEVQRAQINDFNVASLSDFLLPNNINISLSRRYSFLKSGSGSVWRIIIQIPSISLR